MRIGFDLDDTLAKFAYQMVKFAQIYDKQKSEKKAGIVDNDKYITHGMFDWSDKEKQEFDSLAIGKSIPILKPITACESLIRLLKNLNHETYFISARGADGYSRRKDTVRWLKEHNIPYDKLIVNAENKEKAIKKYKIELFIDDRKKCCEMAERMGVKAIQKTYCRWSNIHSSACESWDEVLEKIYEMSGDKPLIEKYPVIIDTDVTNEIDDEWALAYLLSFKNVNLRAITIAQHFSLAVEDIDMQKNVERSYNKAKEIVELCRPELSNIIYKGDRQVSDFLDWEVSEGVKKIIEICRNNDKVIFIGIGAMTNLAHAITLAPDIADKIKLYCLMGELAPNMLAPEYNMSGDFNATKIVLEKIKDKTIFPATGFSNLVLTKYEIKEHLNKDNKVMKLLYDDFIDVTENKFGCLHKSMFDFIIIYYLFHPLDFIQRRVGVKANKTSILFKGKNMANIVINAFPDKPLNELLTKLKNYQK